MCTGHHAAVCAGVHRGSVVGVVGDGAVGLSAVLASARIGAARIISLGSGNPAREALARAFGATDVLAERGDAANAAVMQITGGSGSIPPSNASARANRWPPPLGSPGRDRWSA